MRSAVIAVLAGVASLAPALAPEILKSVDALPAHLAGQFDEISACHISPEGDYLIFDRRAHAVFRIAKTDEAPKKVVQIGIEKGQILRPRAFDSAPDGTFVVADAPGGHERMQIFFYMTAQIGGFTLPQSTLPRLVLGDVVLNGVGALDYTGKSILVSEPESGALVTEFGLDGKTLKTFGELRKTGQEADPEVHLALNGGMALAIPGGGYYFVFLGGVPMFRKYDAQGKMLFERHIEGVEVDELIKTLPNVWPKRRTAEGEFALVWPTVRTAAVDPDGNLWIALSVPYTYVYDSSGDKRRTIQFNAAGPRMPSNLYFAKNGRLIIAPGCYSFNYR